MRTIWKESSAESQGWDKKRGLTENRDDFENYRTESFLLALKISTSDEEKSESWVNKIMPFFLQHNSIILSLKSILDTVKRECTSSSERVSLAT